MSRASKTTRGGGRGKAKSGRGRGGGGRGRGGASAASASSSAITVIGDQKSGDQKSGGSSDTNDIGFGPFYEDRLYILDRELASAISFYPQAMNGDRFTRAIRCYYNSTRDLPEVSHFKAFDKDPGDRPCSRPYLVTPEALARCPGLSAGEWAIREFITKELGVRLKDPVVSTTVLSKLFLQPLDDRTHSVYVCWQDDKEFLHKFWRAFHATESSMYFDDFIIVGEPPRRDYAMCCHTASLETQQRAKLNGDADRENLIVSLLRDHIVNCLHKECKPGERPEMERVVARRHLWLKQAASEHKGSRKTMSPDFWASGHPYWSVYGGKINLSTDETNLMPDVIKEILQRWQINKGVLSEAESNAFLQWSKPIVERIRKTYADMAWDLSPLELLNDWNLPEIATLCVRPPLIRVAPDWKDDPFRDKIQGDDNGRKHPYAITDMLRANRLAMILRNRIFLLSGSGGSTGKNKSAAGGMYLVFPKDHLAIVEFLKTYKNPDLVESLDTKYVSITESSKIDRALREICGWARFPLPLVRSIEPRQDDTASNSISSVGQYQQILRAGDFSALSSLSASSNSMDMG